MARPTGEDDQEDESPVPEQHVNAPSNMPTGEDDQDFSDVWAGVAEQGDILESFDVLSSMDKPIVVPRVQLGGRPPRVRRARSHDEWEDSPRKKPPPKTQGVPKKSVKRRTTTRKLDYWSDCLECGKWRKLLKPVTGTRFLCEHVSVTCSDECDCDEACDCN